MPDDDLRERIARAIEAEVDRMQARRDDPGFDDRTQVYLDGYRAGSLDAARIARETPESPGELAEELRRDWERERREIDREDREDDHA